MRNSFSVLAFPRHLEVLLGQPPYQLKPSSPCWIFLHPIQVGKMQLNAQMCLLSGWCPFAVGLQREATHIYRTVQLTHCSQRGGCVQGCDEDLRP